MVDWIEHSTLTHRVTLGKNLEIRPNLVQNTKTSTRRKQISQEDLGAISFHWRACELLAVCDNAEAHDQMHTIFGEQLAFSYHVVFNTRGGYRSQPFLSTVNKDV